LIVSKKKPKQFTQTSDSTQIIKLDAKRQSINQNFCLIKWINSLRISACIRCETDRQNKVIGLLCGNRRGSGGCFTNHYSLINQT
ncbi:hypothetical protein AQUCO_02000326v1, partial [Aquilegia coerulea]